MPVEPKPQFELLLVLAFIELVLARYAFIHLVLLSRCRWGLLFVLEIIQRMIELLVNPQAIHLTDCSEDFEPLCSVGSIGSVQLVRAHSLAV